MSTQSSARIRKVLVYGANGVQGGAIARQLHAEGFVVRAVVRDLLKAASLSAAGISTVVADLSDVASLRAANEGMHAVALTIPLDWESDNVLRWTRNAAEAARRAQVQLLIFNSGTRVPRAISDVPAFELSRASEQMLAVLGPPTIVLRPPLFLENLSMPHTVSAIQRGVVPYPLAASARVSWLSVADLGAYVAAALRNPQLAGRALDVGGLQALDGPALARELSRARGQPLRYAHVELPELERQLAPMLGSKVARGIARNYSYIAENPDLQLLAGANPELVRELKRELTSVAQWGRAQAWAGA